MYLNLLVFLTSPLEQFEISSFNSRMGYNITLNINNSEIGYHSQIISKTILGFCHSFFYVCLFFILQKIWKKKGFFFILTFVYILVTRYNGYSFTDFVIRKINFDAGSIAFYIFNNVITDYDTFANTILKTGGENLYKSTKEFVTVASCFINFYSITFCFIYIYVVIYLIYNKTLSNNSNSMFPTLYQHLGETLYKVSLNLFYSILGKNISMPEFFIKITTIFIFLIISNVQGMIPYMSTLTSALTNTFFIALALFISIIYTLIDKKGIKYFLNLFMPSGCPLLLSLLIIPIEIISYTFRLVSLSVRLFANMMAGHTLLKVIVGFSWVIVFLGNTFLINLFPILILFILTLLEFGVALIQAYIFTVLSCIYLRDIFEGH